jgi:hypothetical protein
VVALKPDVCSLGFNNIYSGASVVKDTPRNLKIMAEAIKAAGTQPDTRCSTPAISI